VVAGWAAPKAKATPSPRATLSHPAHWLGAATPSIFYFILFLKKKTNIFKICNFSPQSF
jgi:hypothetical protein